MDSTQSPQQKPHAVCIPFPAQGHINPMLKLSKLLNHAGFHISFVHTAYNYGRLFRTNGAAGVEGLPDFQFKQIDDGLPVNDTDTTQNVHSLCLSVLEYMITPFRDLVTNLNNNFAVSSGEVPAVTCIVSDVSMSFTVHVAEELGVPVVLLIPMSACGFSGSAYHTELADRGLIPLKGTFLIFMYTNYHLKTVIDYYITLA